MSINQQTFALFGCADFTSGSILDPTWFALDTSRGIEEPLLKVYMRATVLVSEYLIYVPAIIVFVRRFSRLYGEPAWSASIALVAIFLQPATLLIDHGHFQYNTVMLGFMVASLEGILTGRYLQSCAFFVAALGFKQMALYYSPVMFSFLLGVCIFPKIRIDRFFSIALTTIIAFAVLFAPLIVGSLYHWTPGDGDALPAPLPIWMNDLPLSFSQQSWYYPSVVQLSQAIHRIFPFARGIFEDKVANAWCSIHTFYKLNRFPAAMLQRVSLGATLASIAIPSVVIFLKPRVNLLLYALASSAWGFFLFSFQVHEKSVLLPLLPMTLLLSGENGLGKETRAWVGWANVLGSWTLFPLLKREDLHIPYFIITLLWIYLVGLPPTSFETYRTGENQIGSTVRPLTVIIHIGFYLGMVIWHVLEAFVPPPKGKPDLWVVLNVLVGAVGFSLAYMWCTWKLVSTAFRKGGHSMLEDTKKKQ